MKGDRKHALDLPAVGLGSSFEPCSMQCCMWDNSPDTSGSFGAGFWSSRQHQQCHPPACKTPEWAPFPHLCGAPWVRSRLTQPLRKDFCTLWYFGYQCKWPPCALSHGEGRACSAPGSMPGHLFSYGVRSSSQEDLPTEMKITDHSGQEHGMCELRLIITA